MCVRSCYAGHYCDQTLTPHSHPPGHDATHSASGRIPASLAESCMNSIHSSEPARISCPDNAHPCSLCENGCACDIGYHFSLNDGGQTCVLTPSITVVTEEKRRRLARRDAERRLLCPLPLAACRIFSSNTIGDGYECVDLQDELENCKLSPF